MALEDGGGQLMAAEAELSDALAQLQDGEAQLSAGQAQLEAAKAALSQAKTNLNAQLDTLGGVMAMLSPGTALTSAGAILSPDTAWTQTDGQVLAMLLTADQDGLTSWVMGLVMSGQLTMQQALALQEQLTGMAGTSLTGQFQDMVDQGLMTQDQADGLTAQLTAALTAAAGGVDGEAIRCPRPGTFEVLFQPEHPRALFRRRGGDRLRRAQLSSSAAQLSDGWRQYNEGKAEVDQARAEFEDGVKQSQERSRPCLSPVCS